MTRFMIRATAVLLVAASSYACADAAAPDPLSGPDYASSLGPVIVECPASVGKAVTATIGTPGGSFGIDNHGVDVPRGAVKGNKQFRLEVPVSNYMEIRISEANETDFHFEKPVTVTLDYSRCTRSNIDGRPLSVWHIDPVTKQLLQNMGGIDDPANRRIRFDTDHLSGFAIAE